MTGLAQLVAVGLLVATPPGAAPPAANPSGTSPNAGTTTGATTPPRKDPPAPAPTATPAGRTRLAATSQTTSEDGPRPSGLREPAPRPTAEVRVQSRYAHNLKTMQIFAGIDYLERRDFYVSPGLRVGGTYYVWESVGLDLQVSRYFSHLNQAGVAVEQMLGIVPDSRAPTWLMVGGARYSFGYGKMLLGSWQHAIHFEPQALLQAGLHVHDGSVGPSGLAGVGLMIHGTPRWFFRLEGGMTVEIERRVTGTVTVVGFLPSLVTGGVF